MLPATSVGQHNISDGGVCRFYALVLFAKYIKESSHAGRKVSGMASAPINDPASRGKFTPGPNTRMIEIRAPEEQRKNGKRTVIVFQCGHRVSVWSVCRYVPKKKRSIGFDNKNSCAEEHCSECC